MTTYNITDHFHVRVNCNHPKHEETIEESFHWMMDDMVKLKMYY